MARILDDRFEVKQLKDSIQSIGFLTVDRLVVTPLPRDGKFLVIEGKSPPWSGEIAFGRSCERRSRSTTGNFVFSSNYSRTRLGGARSGKTGTSGTCTPRCSPCLWYTRLGAIPTSATRCDHDRGWSWTIRNMRDPRSQETTNKHTAKMLLCARTDARGR